MPTSAPARWWPPCIREGKTLEELTLDEFKQYSDLFEDDVYTAIDLTTCSEAPATAARRRLSVMKQVADVKGEAGIKSLPHRGGRWPSLRAG